MSQKLIHNIGVKAEKLHRKHWGMTPGLLWCYTSESDQKIFLLSNQVGNILNQASSVTRRGENKTKWLYVYISFPWIMKYFAPVPLSGSKYRIFNMPGYQSPVTSYLTHFSSVTMMFLLLETLQISLLKQTQDWTQTTMPSQSYTDVAPSWRQWYGTGEIQQGTTFTSHAFQHAWPLQVASGCLNYTAQTLHPGGPGAWDEA